MRKIVLYLFVFFCLVLHVEANTVLEPWTYSEDFEDRDLGAWASYPLWQDTAYDPNFRVNEMVPGDPNISIVQKVTPYTHVDNYAGAQKLLDMYLIPETKLRFRYYLKTIQDAEFFTVRFAAGDLGKIDVNLAQPETNKWVWVTVDYKDIIQQNPQLADMDQVKIHALAFLTKIPQADPFMPIYLGLDDISFSAGRAAVFQFKEPAMHKLPEFSQYIPQRQYHSGEDFNLTGNWNLDAKTVGLEIKPFTDKNKTIFKGNLKSKDNQWTLKPLKLSFPEGLYLATLTAYDGTSTLSQTEFTIHIAPRTEQMAGKHPRLLYDEDKKKQLLEKLKEEKYRQVHEDMVVNARREREKIPVESLIFDLDQFPDEDWLPTWAAWGSRIYHTAEALRWNAMAYTFHGDKEAGIYAKNILLKLSEWPNWTHPWQTKRGRFSEHRTGSWSHRVAEAYDLTYDLMSPEESSKIRRAIMENVVKGAHRTYVHNNNITSNTSNWLAMIIGGSLMNMAAMYGDGPETENLEPYLTGALLKYYNFINCVTDSKDGAWGEGLGYNSYSFSNMSYSIPSLINVFNVDLTEPLIGTYNEYIWAGLIKDRMWFEYGDSGGHLNPPSYWAFLLDRYKEPRLGWYYNYLKDGEMESNTSGSNSDVDKRDNQNNRNETFQDVLYETENVPMDSPFDESPVKAFWEVGTSVFKSGWEKDDFVFVMRTGPFYNHQHLDQGSFWLADRGEIFVEERHLKNSTYYDDPLYQPWLTQPVGHSTILINGNHQSQRVGDPLNFVPGFDDYAFIAQFLDGKEAAFTSGDIGRLYWGKVTSLTRNVLYLKPRTVLMLDVAEPGAEDADVTLLYQTNELANIQAGRGNSSININNTSLHIQHLSPEAMDAKAVETPHYLKTLLNDRPLKKEGMLTLTSRTQGKPLVMANLLTTTARGDDPEVSSAVGNGFVSGQASGKNFAFNTSPGEIYQVEGMQTDALSMTWEGENAFIAMATVFRHNNITVQSESPLTFELTDNTIKYYRGEAGEIILGVPAKPSAVLLNGKSVKNFRYDKNEKLITLEVPQGEGTIAIK